MRPEALVLSSDPPRSSDDALASILTTCGVHTRRASPRDLGTLEVTPPSGGSRSLHRLLAIDLSAVAATIERRDENWLAEIVSREEQVLLYGLSGSDAVARALRTGTGGRVRGVSHVHGEAVKYAVASGPPDYCDALSGVTIGPLCAPRDLTLECDGESDDLETLVSAGGLPLFVRVQVGRTAVFVLGSAPSALSSGPGQAPNALPFSQVIPIIMLVRGLFPDASWHPSGRFASLIIDDPPLRQRFGYLDYPRLLGAMDRVGFSTTIAFIPRNRRRTDRRTAALIARRPDRFSVCVHGCDHTRAEFGAADPPALHAASARARLEMDTLRRDHGVEYDRVMVFPHSVFSREGMKALEEQRFSAAVNTVPRAFDDEQPLALDERTDVVVRRYGDLPLFQRRHPDAMGDFALDLFLGRPALIAAHPPDFKEGYDRVSHLAAELSSLDTDVTWTGLGDIGRRLYLVRRAGPSRVHVVSTTDQIVLENPFATRQTFLIARSDRASTVDAVRSSGGSVPFRRLGEHVFFRVELQPGCEQAVEIERALGPEPVFEVPPLVQRIRVVLRRGLSDFRDNRLVHVAALYGLAKWWAARQPPAVR
jgi:hypothetical protein